MKYFNETETSVELVIKVDYQNWAGVRGYYVWIPKSELNENGVPNEAYTEMKAQKVRRIELGGCKFDCWKDADGNTYKN